MTLTIYDNDKGCQVLNPEHFTPVINAFHPDYVKTYMPEFLSSIKFEAMQKAKGEHYASKSPMKMHSIVSPSKAKPKPKKKSLICFLFFYTQKWILKQHHEHQPM